jgi:hypothetical protein
VSMTRAAPSEVEEGMSVSNVPVEEAATGNRTGGTLEALPSCRSLVTNAWGLGSTNSTSRTGSSRDRNIPFAAGRGALAWGGGRGSCAGGFAGGVVYAFDEARGLLLLIRGCRVSIIIMVIACAWSTTCTYVVALVEDLFWCVHTVCVGKGVLS